MNTENIMLEVFQFMGVTGTFLKGLVLKITVIYVTV